jgi:D-arabinose 1-dehydrogenase-like Zn-dependent alcohol dehydrogenase
LVLIEGDFHYGICVWRSCCSCIERKNGDEENCTNDTTQMGILWKLFG